MKRFVPLLWGFAAIYLGFWISEMIESPDFHPSGQYLGRCASILLGLTAAILCLGWGQSMQGDDQQAWLMPGQQERYQGWLKPWHWRSVWACVAVFFGLWIAYLIGSPEISEARQTVARFGLFFITAASAVMFWSDLGGMIDRDYAARDLKRWAREHKEANARISHEANRAAADHEPSRESTKS